MDSDNKSDSSPDRYAECLQWLYSQLPMFSRIGAAAYKPGLDTSLRLDEFFGHPHRSFKSIHIAGTNGKGSTSHMLAAMLQAQGYKTALYTSPHLADFRERMRINGKMIPREKVIDFVDRWRSAGYDGQPSFFELTMMMAFRWFADEEVDCAVIETGMGGRLDSTNIITPQMCVITNISPDHMQFLGSTLADIAREKAGIIKPGIPVVIGQAEGEVREVFRRKAADVDAPIIFAEDYPLLKAAEELPEAGWKCQSPGVGTFTVPLGGDYQRHNINTALHAADLIHRNGLELGFGARRRGLEDVIDLTHLAGRWQIRSHSPLTICDTGHNIAGITSNMRQLARVMASRPADSRLHMVIGFVNDKDVEHIAPLFPTEARYYITQASVPRAMAAGMVADTLRPHGIHGDIFPTVAEAVAAAVREASPQDVIFIGGSTFVVADYLAAVD